MSLQSKPLISIIVPVYNTNIKYFKQCVESLDKQTCSNIEILIIDDGSESKRVKDYKKLLSTSQKVKYIHKERGGVSSARNLGLKKAEGSYVMFVDSDDWLDLDCCEDLVKYIANDPDVIFFSYIKEYSGHRVMVSPVDDPYSMSVFGTSCMKLYKKDSVQGIYFNEAIKKAEDTEYNFRAYRRVQKFQPVGAYFYHYRIVSSSSVRKFDERMAEQYDDTVKAIQKDIDGMTTPELQRAYINALGVFFLMLMLNYVFHKQNPGDRRTQFKEICNKDYVKELFAKSSQLMLPITRKMPILLAKYHCYALVWLVMKIKQKADK